MIRTITLNPSIDRNIHVRSLLMDDTNRAEKISDTAGGKGLNVSKVVRELGGQTKAYVLLGGHLGEWFADLAKPLDIPLVLTPIRGATRLNIVLTDQKTQTRISASGPNVAAPELKKFTQQVCKVASTPGYWALGGSLPPGIKTSFCGQLIQSLQKRGSFCVLDMDNEALKVGIKAKPFMIKPNEFEVQRLMGYSMKSIGDYLKAAKALNQKGIRLVVVSLAKRGALFVTREKAIHVLAPKVTVRSKIGAGDSLIGGFLLGLERKMPFEQAARLGVAASVSAVMREAPRLCLRSDIPKLLSRITIHNL